MTKIHLLLTSVAAAVVAACTVEEDVAQVCHFPDANSDEFEVISVSQDELEEHILDDGDLCYSAADQACYEPDFDGWDQGGELCPS